MHKQFQYSFASVKATCLANWSLFDLVCRLEQMAEARAEGQSQFLQLYVEKDRASSKEMVERADKLGFQGLFLTVRMY
jgi:isopentenyl diphosphate isomerase/L-lactate dehydrogenase-like FMN-dependent dehydrogenase